VGGSGSTGTTGSSTTADRVYRITLRMDDGSTRVVTQETTPDFRSGDRVNLTSGAVMH
jgi:outer membrane lipoprotein SlyB